MQRLPSDERDGMRRILLSILKLAISAALLYVALRNADFAALSARLTWASAGWLVLAIMVTLLQIEVSALRWQVVSPDCGASLGTLQALRYNMIGAFFNQTLPSSIGGDAVRLWLLARAGSGWRAASYSVFLDRAIGLIALGALILASLPWSLDLIADANGRTALLMTDLVVMSASVGFLVLGWLPWPFLKRWWMTRHPHACSVIANRVIFSAMRGPGLAALSLVVHLLAIVIAWCAVRAIAAPVLFSEIFLLIPPVMLITMLPISMAGWGVREATMALAFGYAGLAETEGVNVSLLFGATYFLVGALGGLVWIASAEKAAKGAEAIQVPEQVLA